MSTTKIILSNSADWEEWNKRFTSQAIANDLLDHVQGKEALLRKPVAPQASKASDSRFPPKGSIDYD